MIRTWDKMIWTMTLLQWYSEVIERVMFVAWVEVFQRQIRASAGSTEIACQLKNKNEAMETDLITLKEEMATIKEILKSNPQRTAH